MTWGTCYCGNTRVERTANKSQHTKLTLEKNILLPLLPRFELAIFRSRVRHSYQQTIPALTNKLLRLCFFVNFSLTQRTLVIQTLRISSNLWKAFDPEIPAFLELYELVPVDDFQNASRFNKGLGNYRITGLDDNDRNDTILIFLFHQWRIGLAPASMGLDGPNADKDRIYCYLIKI